MPTVVEIPNVGVVEFPDGMSQDDVARESESLYSRHSKAQPTPREPGFFEQRFKVGALPAEQPSPGEMLQTMETPEFQTKVEEAKQQAGAAAISGQPPVMRSLKELGEKAVTPAVRLVRMTPQMVQDAFDFMAPYWAAAEPQSPFTFEEAQRLAGEPSRTPTAAAKVTSGLINAAETVPETFTSPLGVATLGAGQLGATGARLVSGGFAAYMLASTPAAVNQWREAVKTGDAAAISEASAGLALHGLMTVAAGRHAVTSPRTIQAKQLANAIGLSEAEAARFMETPEWQAAVERAATASVKPIERFAPKTAEAMREMGPFKGEFVETGPRAPGVVVTPPVEPPMKVESVIESPKPELQPGELTQGVPSAREVAPAEEPTRISPEGTMPLAEVRTVGPTTETRAGQVPSVRGEPKELAAAERGIPAEITGGSPSVKEAVSLAQFHDPQNMGSLLGAFQHAHKAGYLGREAQQAAWGLYSSTSENATIKDFGEWLKITKRIEELMRPTEKGKENIYASSQPSPAQVGLRGKGSEMGTSPPLRQPGEPAVPRPEAEGKAPEAPSAEVKPAEAAPAETGKVTGEPPLPNKGTQYSINRALWAIDRITTNSKKHLLENLLGTLNTHARKLGIPVEDVGTFFSVEKYRKVARDVQLAIGQKYGSHPTAELRVARDKVVAAKTLRRPEEIKTPQPKAAPTPPVEAATKMQSEVSDVAKTEGQRPAKEVKAELIRKIEEALHGAPEKSEWKASEHGYVEIHIPGDGDFTVPRNKTALGEIRQRAQRLKTGIEAPKPAYTRGAFDYKQEAIELQAQFGTAWEAAGKIRQQLDALGEDIDPATLKHFEKLIDAVLGRGRESRTTLLARRTELTRSIEQRQKQIDAVKASADRSKNTARALAESENLVASWKKALDEVNAALEKDYSALEAMPVKQGAEAWLDTKTAKLRAEQPKPSEIVGMGGARPEELPPLTPAATVARLTAKEAKQAARMESKVKLPVEYDLERLNAQFDIFNNEIGEALTTGGQFLAKKRRPAVAKGAPAEAGSVTSKEINQYFTSKLATLVNEMRWIKSELARQASPEHEVYLDLVLERAKHTFRQVQELRRTSHESLAFWNKIKAEMMDMQRALGIMGELKPKVPILDQLWRDTRAGEFRRAGKDLLEFARVNLFTLGSWTLDFATNLAVASTKLPAFAMGDVVSLIRGRSADRMASALRALWRSAQNLVPGERFRLSQEIESRLGTVAGAEFQGYGKEVMMDFSEILKNNPAAAEQLKKLDIVMAAPVRMKRATDNFFGRLGASTELYHQAYQAGRQAGLRGDDLQTFVENFFENPPKEAIDAAVKEGKEWKFNRDLTEWEEKFAANVVTKLAIEAYPRWTLQFVRWAGEMIGANPGLYLKIKRGTATQKEVIDGLVKAATGWGGIVAFNQLVYDNIDANTMEYVKEDGDRVRLSGRTPAPELFFITALLRGDLLKAKAALPQTSIPLAKLLGGEPGGIISPVVDTMRESVRGRYTAERTASELTKLLNNAIPGKSVLGFLRALHDPTIREGLGAPIPGVASLLPQKIEPTTGEPAAPKQRIPGTTFTFPTVGGTPFPGAVRDLNAIQAVLLNHGIAVMRPRRTSIIELPAEDVPKAQRLEYERMAGQNVKRIVGEAITNPEFWQSPPEIRRKLLQAWLSEARAQARNGIAEKYGTSSKQKKSEPIPVGLLPDRFKPK